ncbi:MAG: hypothetical protein ACHQO8_07565 [Vicinamibacterales bacterium]
MRTLRRAFFVFVPVSAIALLALSTLAHGQAFGAPERFSAFAVQMHEGQSWTGSVDILITRWSTPAERDRLMALLIDEGPDALLDALRGHQPAGSLRTPSSLGQDLRLAWSEPAADGGRHVTVLTDRPIGFWEAMMRPRSIDYPLTIIEMQIDRDGEGEGRMWIAARVTVNSMRDHIELEDYALEPVRLMSIRSSRLTH